jgi:8-oxo-dGTP pyrophosphatase MutT (NUDIX family)
LKGRKVPVRQKVYAYITCKSHLLVFEHVDFPEAGIQVPGGKVEPGEDLARAVLREVREETDLKGVDLLRYLGSVERDLSEFGLHEIHQRHYFHCGLDEFYSQRWIACEHDPSDGSEGPIAFSFYWVSLESVPPLAGGTDEILKRLGR